MRRTVLFALMISLALLGGCSSTEVSEKEYEEFHTNLLGAETIEIDANVKANYSEKVVEYTLHYLKSGDNATIEVTAPTIIAGIKASIKDGEDTLEYDGLIINTGDLTEDGLSPISSIPSMVKCMIESHITQVWKEEYNNEDALVVQAPLSDVVNLTIWFNSDVTKPFHFEITHLDKVVLVCDITEWSTK